MLENVKTGGNTSERLRIFVYGTEGIGKTSFASQFPSPIVIDTEDGAGKIKGLKYLKADSLNTVYEVINALITEQHEFKTFVVDSVDWLERMIWNDICQRFSVQSIEKVDGGYGKGYVYALDEWRKFILSLKPIREQCKMHIVLVGHSQLESFIDPDGVQIFRYSPRLHKKSSAMICEWSDAVLFATRENGANMGDDGGQRVLRTSGSARFVAKNRFGFPTMLPLNYESIKDELKKFYAG